MLGRFELVDRMFGPRSRISHRGFGGHHVREVADANEAAQGGRTWPSQRGFSCSSAVLGGRLVAPMGHRGEAQVTDGAAPSEFEASQGLPCDAGVPSSRSPDAEMRGPGCALGLPNLDLISG